MIEIIDLKEERYESIDLSDLELLLRQLIGQPFLAFRVSYGDELRLHLGAPRLAKNSRLKGKAGGTYILGARASHWFLTSVKHSRLLASDESVVQDTEVGDRIGPGAVVTGKSQVDVRQIELKDYVTQGAVIVMARPIRTEDGFALVVKFSDGSTFFVHGFTSDNNDEDVADWEILFAPHSRHLEVGPGFRWSYLSSLAKS